MAKKIAYTKNQKRACIERFWHFDNLGFETLDFLVALIL